MPNTNTIATILDGRRDGQEYADLFGFPPDLLDAVEATAFERYKAGRYDEAQTLLQGVAVIDARRYYPHLLLAEVHLKQARLDAAVEAIEQAFALKPDDPSVRVKLAEILIHDDRPQEARQHLEFLLGAVAEDQPHHTRAQMIIKRLEH